MEVKMSKDRIKALWIVVILILFCQYSFSQGFKVKEFKQNINDGSAFHAPMDAEGHPCGLIKVRTENAELKFKGNIVGDVENKTNEYWVYMAHGSKLLNILHPNYLPILVDFDAYGIGEISSKSTYLLTLSEQKYNKEKAGLVATVKPETASLYIDDVFIENLSGNGLYQLYLSKGDHICRIEQKGFRPNVQVMTTGKGTQNLNVELESVMAELDVKCKTGTAEIYIDGELKGNGSWKGSIFAGEHQIEARQQNFESNSQTISIAEKESRAFIIPELKRSMGKIRVETIPSNMPVIIDGKSVGVSPCIIDIESGKHYVTCKSYGCAPVRSDIEINSGETQVVKLKIEYSDNVKWLQDYYRDAYTGDSDAILKIICEKCRHEEYEEAFFWVNRHPDKEKVIMNWMEYGRKMDDAIYGWWQCDWIHAYSETGKPEKALELYPIIKSEEERNGGMFSSDLEMGYIGNGFFKKKEFDKAIQCYEEAGRYGYEGLGDCYKAKGNKEQAAIYYKKSLNLDYHDGRDRVEKKLKELEN